MSIGNWGREIPAPTKAIRRKSVNARSRITLRQELAVEIDRFAAGGGLVDRFQYLGDDQGLLREDNRRGIIADGINPGLGFLKLRVVGLALIEGNTAAAELDIVEVELRPALPVDA